MSLCPLCKEKINYLNWTLNKTDIGNVGLDNEGNVEYDEDYNPFKECDFKFFCPECEKVIFDNSLKAEEFLKGGADKP